MKVSNTFIAHTARRVMMRMGSGHSESVYQGALLALFMSAGVPAMSEVVVPYFMNNVCVGLGRIDVLLPTHVIEIKASGAKKEWDAERQLAKYMRALGPPYREGVSLYFDYVEPVVLGAASTKPRWNRTREADRGVLVQFVSEGKPPHRLFLRNFEASSSLRN